MSGDYSEAELKLFDFFGYREVAEKAQSISASGLYQMCVEKAFRENMKGPEVEALRRAANAFAKCKPYRMTPEFEALLVCA